MRKREHIERLESRVETQVNQLANKHLRIVALEDALRPFTGYDLHALQHIAGLEHDGHPLRAIHVEDCDALIKHIARARTVLDLPGSTWSGHVSEVIPGAYIHEDGSYHDDRGPFEADVPAPPPHWGERGGAMDDPEPETTTHVATHSDGPMGPQAERRGPSVTFGEPAESEAEHLQRRIRHLEGRIGSQRRQIDHLISDRKQKNGRTKAWHEGREALLSQHLTRAHSQWLQERDRRLAVEAELKALKESPAGGN